MLQFYSTPFKHFFKVMREPWSLYERSPRATDVKIRYTGTVLHKVMRIQNSSWFLVLLG
jgi:hypothetical protein